MTTYDPTLSALDHPDHLGGALQQGLPRPMNPKLTWGLIRTFLLSGISGGIAPVLLLPKRFRNFATAEQVQFWHLAEWLRLQTGDIEAAEATEAAKRVTPGIGLRLASIAFVVVAIGIACTALQHDGAAVPKWFALTLPELRLPPAVPRFAMKDGHWSNRTGWGWGTGSGSGSVSGEDWVGDGAEHYSHKESHSLFSDDPAWQWRRYYHPSDPSGSSAGVPSEEGWTPNGDSSSVSVATNRSPLVPIDLVNAFALAMSGAALCWLIEVNAHIARVRRFVGAFNQLSGRFGVGPVRPPGVQLGLRPLWLLGAAATCALGGFWAVPVMLAAAAHRRYIRSTSLRLRTDLARRQRDVLLARRPVLRVPASTHLMGACPQDNCRAANPPEAVYCRRCGTRMEEG